MRVLITGATGLIGRRLVLDRLERGDRLVVVSRDAARARRQLAADANPSIEVVEGDPSVPGAWQSAVDGCDAVVHLAGAGVADRRWTREYKRLIVNSRVDSTFQVVEAIRRAASPPRVLVNASATGWYGDVGDRETGEEGEAGGGDFLAELTMRWEREAEQACALGIRVVMLRIGLVLDERGGALKPMMRPFRMFVGGPIGSGRQYVPWIHWRDLVGLVDLALRHESVQGPINATAPNPVTNRAFSRALGAALRRPSWLPVPGPALRIAIGELARYALMSQRIVPTRATELDYAFVYPEVQAALEVIASSSRLDDPRPSGEADPGGDDDGPPAAAARTTGATGAAKGGAAAGRRPVAPVRLLAIGVDGALLRSDGTVGRGVARACRAAQRAGCVVVLATARPPRSTRGIARALDLVGPMINYNGAVIWNPADDAPQYHEPLDPAVTTDVIATARAVEPDLCVGLEVLDRWFTDRIEPSASTGAGRPLEPDGIGPLEEFLGTPVTQLNLFGTPSQIAAVRPAVEARFWRPRLIALFSAAPSLIQIVHPLADEGIALQRIAQRMGLSRDAVMVVGGAANDMGMIEWAGFGVVTANAMPAVRAIADVAVPSNDEDGVALAIQRHVLAPA